MTTATRKSETVLKWEKQWDLFFDDEITNIVDDDALHFFTQRERVEALNYASSNIDLILEKLDEMRVIFDHLIESQHLLHYFLEDDYPNQFHSLAFEMQINNCIEIKLIKTDSTEEELFVECIVSIEGELLIFRINEQTANVLEIEMPSE